MYLISLLATLVIYWLVLSGFFDNGLLLSLGAVSCVITAWLCHRMRLIDDESHPHHLAWRLPPYWLKLSVETLRSNWSVIRVILNPSSRGIAPVTGHVPTPVGDDVVRATLANAITLTPGTLTLNVEDDRMLIHALNQDMLDDIRQGQMVPWASQLEKS